MRRIGLWGFTLVVAWLQAGNLWCQAPLTINTTTFAPGSVGSQYAQALNWTGGTAPYTWSLTSGSLPPGLTLLATGGVIGTPTTGGTYKFTLTVTDARQLNASQTFTIIVAGPKFSIATTSPLPSGVVGQAFTETLTANSGTAPFQWTVGTGFPSGLFLSSSGVISGTPTKAGVYTFTVQATDAAQNTASATFSLTIQVPPLTITTVPPLFGGAVGQSYAQTFTAAGGSPPYSWSIVSGNTGGLTLDASRGVLSGVPQSAATLTFTIQVADSSGATAQQNFSITINPPALILTAVSSLAPGTVGVSYSQAVPVTATGGTPPYSWTILSGLPPGLTFDPVALALNGTPTSSGAFSLNVQVTDSTGVSASKSLALTIAPAFLSITTSRQLPDGLLNTFYSQALTATGGTAPYSWSATGLPAGVTINSSTGVISGTPTAAGTFPLAITVNDSAVSHFSDRFTLNVDLPAAPSVTLSGLPDSVGPTQQYALTVTLGNPFPADITGQLILSFSPDTGPTDQTIQFASGGTTANFTVPAGSTTASGSAPLMLQVGTVSGIVTVSVRLQAGGIDITPSPAPTASAQIAAAAPVIKGMQVTRTSNSLSIVVTGYCTAREVTQAVFAFSPASGQTLQSTASSVTIDLSTLFGKWFQDPGNSQFGTQFIYTQSFNISQGSDPTQVIPVSVTLGNRIGSVTSKF